VQPSEVSEEEWICRFIEQGEWDDNLKQPTPGAFRASGRELSSFHVKTVQSLGSELKDLCIDRLESAGEACLQVKACIELCKGISPVFDPKVYWRPEKVAPAWQRWKEAHVQIESERGNASFPMTYRSLLAENASHLRPPNPA
jgi:hypothetical protein